MADTTNIIKLLKAVQTLKVKKTADNPFFKSKYMTLDDIMEQVTPILNKNKCIIYHCGKDGYIYTVIQDTESKDSIDSCLPIKGDDPQKVGASVTYYRRYNLCMLLDILADEDDDGNKASGKKAVTEQPMAKEAVKKYVEKKQVVAAGGGVPCQLCKKTLTTYKELAKFPDKLIYECGECKNDKGYPLGTWVDKDEQFDKEQDSQLEQPF